MPVEAIRLKMEVLHIRIQIQKDRCTKPISSLWIKSWYQLADTRPETSKLSESFLPDDNGSSSGFVSSGTMYSEMEVKAYKATDTCTLTCLGTHMLWREHYTNKDIIITMDE